MPTHTTQTQANFWLGSPRLCEGSFPQALFSILGPCRPTQLQSLSRAKPATGRYLSALGLIDYHSGRRTADKIHSAGSYCL